MTYRIEVTPAARRDLKKLPSEVLRRVDAHLLAIAENPHPPGAQKIAASDPLYRVRIGDYRILYLVEHQRLVVVLVRVGHRREVYRRVP